MIKQYVRDRKNQKRGVLVAILEDNKRIRVGWSLCSRKDRFDPSLGERIAFGRAAEGGSTALPRSIEDAYGQFVQRAQRYFQAPVNPKATDYPSVGTPIPTPVALSTRKPSVRQVILANFRRGQSFTVSEVKSLCKSLRLEVAADTPQKILSMMSLAGELERFSTGLYVRQ